MPTFTIPIHEHGEPGQKNYPHRGKTPAYLKKDIARLRKAGVSVRMGGSSHAGAGLGIQLQQHGGKKELLSVLRHEAGHLTQSPRDVARVSGFVARKRPTKAKGRLRVQGTRASSRFADEAVAWKNAIQQSKTGRVDWTTLTRALRSYEERPGDADAVIRRLRRYARFVRAARG